jgi:tetratricopeptide (TPR) repeat protein
MPGVRTKYANARLACRLTGLNVTGRNFSRPSSGIRLTAILAAAVLPLLLPAAVGFAAAPPALRSLGEAGAGKAQPQTPQQKQEQQVLGQLTKAWSALYADKYEDAVTQAEVAIKQAGTQYRQLALEAVHVQARACLAQGSKPAQAKARQLWQQLEQSGQLAKTSPSGATATRVKIAKALELEAAAGGEPARTASGAANPSPSKGEVAPRAGGGAGGGVYPAKPIDQAKLKLAIDALEAIVKASQPNPAAAEAGIDLARLYCKARRPDDAKAALQAVIDMMSGKENVTRMEIPEALAKVYVNAAKAAMKDIKYDTNDGLAEFEAAEKLRKAEKFADAMRAYQAVAQDFPKTDYAPRSDLHVGDCLLGLGQTAAAMAHWKKFIAPAPAGPWRGQAYVGVIDYCLEEQLDLPEAGKYADLARNSLPSALHSLGDAGAAALASGMGVSPMRPTGVPPVDNSSRSDKTSGKPSLKTLTNTGGTPSAAAESWGLVAYDIHLRVGLVSFCQGQTAQAVAAFEAAKAATTNKQVAESLDALISAAKTGKAVIPEDCFAVGSSSASGSGSSSGQSEILNSKSAISLALSMGIIHLLAGRPDNADNMFDRIVGPAPSPSGGGKGGGAPSPFRLPPSAFRLQQQPPLPGSSPAQLSFATFGRGAVLQARKKSDDAKPQFLASIKAFPAGSWHDETLYRLATITQDQANPSPSKGEVAPGAGGGGSGGAAAAMAAKTAQATKIIAAKSAALPYWQEIISRYPKSPRCEQAFYNAGVLLYEIAEAADAPGLRSSKSEAGWKAASFMLGRFTELYPKSPYAGDAYVREIDIALERMFDLNLAAALAPLAAAWVEQADVFNTNSGRSLSDSVGDPWREPCKNLSVKSGDEMLLTLRLRMAFIAYLKRDHDLGLKTIREIGRLSAPTDWDFKPNVSRIGAGFLAEAIRDNKEPVPAAVLKHVTKDAQRTALGLADAYLTAMEPQRASAILQRMIDRDSVFGNISPAVEAYCIWQLGRARYRDLATQGEALKVLERLYNPQYASYPWTGEGLLCLGVFTFNTTQSPDKALPHYEYVFKSFPHDPAGEKAMFFYCKNLSRKNNTAATKAACDTFLTKYPKSQWVRHVQTIIAHL